MLSDTDFRAVITDASQQFAELIEDGDLGATVSSCPGWTLTELAQHVCGTQRWATQVFITGEAGEFPKAPTERTELLAYFNEGARQLTEASIGTDPERPTWSFGPEPRIAKFWTRRQAHEIAVHLWDAYDSQGKSYEISNELAIDGVQEISEVFLPMRLRRGTVTPVPQKLVLAPIGSNTRIEIATDPLASGPIVTLTGSASDLLLLLWGRKQLSAVEINGDATLAQEFLAQGVSP
ncbi:MAG: maleylpyruvate isomerase family mycothiol-dependent enzyme [Actinomycetes bacterium]